MYNLSMIRRVLDWDSIREYHISNSVTISQTAAEFGVERAQVSRRASKENWGALRKARWEAISQRASELVIEQHAHERADAILLCDNIIRRFMVEMQNPDAEPPTLQDALSAAKFREVLRGSVSDRTEKQHTTWRDYAVSLNVDPDELERAFGQRETGSSLPLLGTAEGTSQSELNTLLPLYRPADETLVPSEASGEDSRRSGTD